MPVFEAFRKKHPASHCRAVGADEIASYQNRLPQAILDLWQDAGQCAYSDGLMWFVNPDDYAGIMDAWLEEPDHSLVFARSSFGELFTWNGEAIYQLFIHVGSYGRLMKDITVYMESVMINNRILEDSHDLKLHKKALKKLGPLAYDECYTFVPALALGGEESITNVAKVKHLEHLLFLAQVHGKIRPA
jgi:hypothetical protein